MEGLRHPWGASSRGLRLAIAYRVPGQREEAPQEGRATIEERLLAKLKGFKGDYLAGLGAKNLGFPLKTANSAR